MRRGMLGGDVGDRADTNDEELLVLIEDVSLTLPFPFSLLGSGDCCSRYGDSGAIQGEVSTRGEPVSRGISNDFALRSACRVSLLPCSNLSAKLLK
jgi:hypothetical protein